MENVIAEKLRTAGAADLKWVASLCSAATLVWLASGIAAKAQCQGMPDARIDVEVKVAPTETVFDTDLSKLERLARAAGREAHLPLMAVYSSSIVYVAEIESRVEPTQQGRSCAVTKSVNIEISVRKRTIHTAHELRDRTCLRTAAINHATAHARHQEDRLLAAREAISVSLKAALRMPAPEADSAVEAEQKLARKINTRIDALLSELDSERAESSRALDSIESLARLRAACPAESVGSEDERT